MFSCCYLENLISSKDKQVCVNNDNSISRYILKICVINITYKILHMYT